MDTYLKTTGFIEQTVLFKKKSGEIYCIGSRSSDKYLYAPCREANIIYFILHEIDKGKSLSEIQILVGDKYKLSEEWMDNIIHKCKKSGLIEVAENEKIKKDIDEFELLMVNLRDFSLERLYPYFSFITRYLKSIVVFMTCIMITALVSLFFSSSIRDFPWEAVFSDPRALIYMWVIQFLSLVLHEFAHAVVGFKFGARPKLFSIAVFYYCMLIFYIRLPGIYFQEEKQRIKIWSAGIFTNMFLASCFWLLFVNTNANFKLIFAVGTISNIMLALNNLLPFFYSDGYYILATLLKTPNLRKRSFFQLKKLIKSGISKENTIYWIYLLVTVIVSGTVLGGQFLIIGKSVYSSVLAGNGLLNILKDYSNLLIIFFIAIIGKIIAKIKKCKYRRES